MNIFYNIFIIEFSKVSKNYNNKMCIPIASISPYLPNDKSKVVYVGAGYHTAYLSKFDTMICFDSQPKSEFGTETFPGSSRPNFIAELQYKYAKKGFELIERKENRLLFANASKSKTVIYHCSVAFPHDLTPIMIEDMKGYNTIICDGYMPHKCLLEYTNCNDIHFVGSDKTCYLYPEKDVLELTECLDWELNRDSSRVSIWTLYHSYWQESEEEYQFSSSSHLTSIRDY